jgi:hypothetical protein
MAKIDNNPLLQGVKGSLGKTMVVKTARGKLIMANRPKKTTKAPSEAQASYRQRFLEAVFYAKGQMQDAVQAALYATGISTKVTSAYGVAVADYLAAPKIVSVNTDEYVGVVGNTIVVRAIDDFRVVSVQLVLRNESGAVIEQGHAVIDPQNAMHWIYTITQAQAAVAGTSVRVVVRDRPGNAVEQTVQL